MDLDFTKARLQHHSWRLRLRRYLEDDEVINRAEAVSPYECALGKWLYSEGLRKYENQPEMAKLESVHAQMHNVVARVVALKESGDGVEARREYQHILPLSRTVVSLLNSLEKNMDPPLPESRSSRER